MACVGKAMGEGNSKKARIYLKLAVIGALIINFVVAFMISIFKDSIALIFTKNELIVKQIREVLIIMAVVLIITGIQLVLGGGIRGLGL